MVLAWLLFPLVASWYYYSLTWIWPKFSWLSAETPIIDTGYARYIGTYNSTVNVTSYLGVRYAASPSGKLRFRAPHPVVATSGSMLQLATSQPQACIVAEWFGMAPATPYKNISSSLTKQAISPSEEHIQGDIEDCLFLNIYYSGKSVPRKLLPVVVWIHGGGYNLWNTSMFKGEDLVKASNHNVVVVVIQYRLGLFGFLAGQDVKDDGDLNAGLLDQEFALRWVQRHISKFGGNPSKVTIWGHSAGAGSVIQHILAHGGKTVPPLFRGAITSSAYLPSQYTYNDDIPQAIYNQVVALSNCSSSYNSLACLRSTNVTVLKAVNVALTAVGFHGSNTFVPVVDGSFIGQSPIKNLAERKFNKVAIMAVTNTYEGRMFVDESLIMSGDGVHWYSQELFPKFGAPEGAKVAQVYDTMQTSFERAYSIMGDAIFICPTYYLMSAFGHAYKAHFAVSPADHGDDLAYYFPSTFSPVSFPHPDFARAFVDPFFSFIANLDPNSQYKINESGTTPKWEQWTRQHPAEMVFNKTTEEVPEIVPGSTDEGLLERCNFWVQHSELIGQ